MHNEQSMLTIATVTVLYTLLYMYYTTYTVLYMLQYVVCMYSVLYVYIYMYVMLPWQPGIRPRLDLSVSLSIPFDRLCGQCLHTVLEVFTSTQLVVPYGCRHESTVVMVVVV